MKEQPTSLAMDARVRIGHVHLKVADLERAIGFYREVLGFELTQRMGGQAAFLSAGGYHHHFRITGNYALQISRSSAPRPLPEPQELQNGKDFNR